MPFGRQERQRRGLAHDNPACEFVRRRLEETAILFKELGCVVEWMNYQAGQYLWSELVKLKLEGGDHSEVAAATA